MKGQHEARTLRSFPEASMSLRNIQGEADAGKCLAADPGSSRTLPALADLMRRIRHLDADPCQGEDVLRGWVCVDGKEEGAMFTGVKVFSATKGKEREALGETVTAWMREHRDLEIVDKEISLSSDNEFHCLSVILFYRPKDAA
jgi:hypothetical protein